jgi:hypothetical protein
MHPQQYFRIEENLEQRQFLDTTTLLHDYPTIDEE